jgi:hypothetical protein
MQTHADVLPSPVERVGEPQCRQALARSVANAFARRRGAESPCRQRFVLCAAGHRNRAMYIMVEAT